MTDEASSSLETGAVTTLFLVIVPMVRYACERPPLHPRVVLAAGESNYNELRKVNSCCFSTGLKSRKRLDTCLASPRWRVIASCNVNDLRSCIYRGLVRKPHRAAVRNLSAVSCGGVCTMPSPVSMSCSRKSLNG